MTFNKRDKVLWSLAAATVFWGLWRERNNRIFDNIARSFNQILHLCFDLISHWSCLCSGRARELISQTFGQSLMDVIPIMRRRNDMITILSASDRSLRFMSTLMVYVTLV